MDQTILIDDMLTARYHACLLCGHKAVWMEGLVVGGQARLGTLCLRCRSTRGWDAVGALLAERYGVLQDATQTRED